ncbi:hypothetical protein [Paenibacillus zanthoxyli]|uniref:hypothetical protein n=1 Tax=Paenibacillus zanthoxyli TaxID=369399 RepID=UPI00046F5DB6|nr:hypothetical protein [Paenibacillus zanthoxyli]
MKKLILPLVIIILLAIAFPKESFAVANEPTSLIPVMTSNTAPSGVASASSIWSVNHQPFNAFNNNNNDLGWASIQGKPYGWIAYEFENPEVVNYYALTARGQYMNNVQESPKDWTFEGWNGNEWIVLDTQSNITGWTTGAKREFSFNNETEYKKYRLNISKNNGYPDFVTIGEIKMSYSPNENPPSPEPTPTITPEPTATPEPTVTPTPTSTPEQPTGDRAILVVTMNTGLEKEYDLPMSEINAFLSWYDSASGSTRYGIDKHDNNKGPFSKRTDYVIFDKILTFEVSEYTASE